MTDVWIRENGKCSEADAVKYIKEKSGEFSKFVALCTDRMAAADISAIDEVLSDAAHLLDLRMFCEDSELHLFRSMMGHDFTYRLADDRIIKEKVKDEGDFFSTPESYVLEVKQKLDIDTKNPPKTESRYGGKTLRTTGGGVYELPINDENAVILVNYIRYDENGIGNAVDFRIKGFGRIGG